jgi:hypothetical protein
MVTISGGVPDKNHFDKDKETKTVIAVIKEPIENKSKGIKIDVLNQYSKLLADKHQDVIPMILRGVGVDVDAKDPRISLNAFLNLYWILEYGAAQKNELIQFWTRVLDPNSIFLVKKEQVINFFNNLSQGRFSKSNKEMFSYARDVWEFFQAKNLLCNNNAELDISKLRSDLMSGIVDINVFSDIFTIGFDPQLNQKEE